MGDQQSSPTPLDRLTPLEKLNLAIRSAQPLLYLVSSEERRVVAEVCRFCRGANLRPERQVWVWDLVEGLRRINMEKLAATPSAISWERWDATYLERDTQLPSISGGADPRQATDLAPLAALRKAGSLDPSLVFLLDFHRYLDPTYQISPVIVRQLRDLVPVLQVRRTSLLLVSPVFPTLPPELEREVEVIDFGLPSRQELGAEVLDLLVKRQNYDLPAADRESLLRAAEGLTLAEGWQAYARSLVHTRTVDAEVVTAQKQQTIRKAQLVQYVPVKDNMQNVGGLDRLKEWLEARRRNYTAEAAAQGIPPAKGILLLGVPGSGKSLVAQVVAANWKYPLVRLDVGSLFGSYLGQSEANMRRALSTAEAVAPCVLWLDEVEKAFGGVMTGQDAGAGRRLFGYFLTWLQEKRSPVFVVATANSFDGLPPEFLRQGRFDAIFFLDLPSPAEREEIWRIQLAKQRTAEQDSDTLLRAEDFDLAKLAKLTDGFSGAEIEQAVVSAMQAAFSEQRRATMDDMCRAVKNSVTLSRTTPDAISALRRRGKEMAQPASSEQPEVETYGGGPPIGIDVQ